MSIRWKIISIRTALMSIREELVWRCIVFVTSTRYKKRID
jgi:hypothetical protein